MSSPATGVLLRMIEIFVNGDVSEVARTVADEYVDHQGLGHGPLHGRAGFAQVVAAARRGVTDLHVSVEDVVEQEDRVAARLRWRGQAPDGTEIDRESLDIVRVEGGRAVEHWGCSRRTDVAAD